MFDLRKSKYDDPKNCSYITNISYGENIFKKEQGLVLRADNRWNQAGSISSSVTLGKPFNLSAAVYASLIWIELPTSQRCYED